VNEFVHLRAHSEYSLLYSAVRIADLAQVVKADGMTALGVADRGGLYGPVTVYRTLLAAGLQPSLGATLEVVRERSARAGREGPVEIVVYALGQQGFAALCQLLTQAALQSVAGERYVTWEELFAKAPYLLCLTGGELGPFGQLIVRGKDGQLGALRQMERLREVFADRLYIELTDQGAPTDRTRNRELVQLARQAGIQTVATSIIRHIPEGGARVVDILRGVEQGLTLEEAVRQRSPHARYHFVGQNEMRLRFAEWPEALRATTEVAARARAQLPVGELHMPQFPAPDGQSEIDYLRHLAEAGLRSRLPRADARYDARLRHELTIIAQMGFAGYFLIVWDFMRFAHEQGISTGPGRGSAAGSLVSYVLRITDVDPVEYNLLFERFLSPERVSWPDIDIDFEAERRHEVIAYVARRYGADRVAQIGTLGTFAARAAVRDVGRVLQTPPVQIEELARMLPAGPGASLQEALTTTDELKQLLERAPSLKRVLDAALAIEGLPRHASIHAAGVVIAVEPLTRWTPLMQGTEETLATQYSMEDVEALGLLKMDFLGLRTLTLCDRTLAHIKQTRAEEPAFAAQTFDAQTLALLAAGDTDGCFQLESAGVKQVLRALRPEGLEDLIAVISLYRPGPMEQIDAYIAARRGGKIVRYEPPELQQVLERTHGILIYQEQIMQIASLLAGFTLGQADVLRRAISKKKREELAQARVSFVAGCLTMGHSERVANDVYDLIVRFADYGFNRSHAAAYAVLAYRTAYLKANYRPEYMAALITDSSSRPEKVAQYALACTRAGIAVLPPDVNLSGPDCAPESVHQGEVGVRLGLFSIRHVSVQAVLRLLEERQAHGPFSHLDELCARVDSRAITRRVLESLVQAGACDSFGQSRTDMLAGLDVLARTERSRKGTAAAERATAAQLALPGMEESDSPTIGKRAGDNNQEQEDDPKQLEAWEKELLGVVLSSRPYEQLRRVRKELGLLTLSEHSADSLGGVATLHWLGEVAKLRSVQTKKGEAMAFLTLEDETARVEIVVFPTVFRRLKQLPELGQLWQTTVRRDPGGKEAWIATALMPASQLTKVEAPITAPRAEPLSTRTIYIKIDRQLEQDPARLATVRDVLLKHSGKDRVVLVYETGKAKALGTVQVDAGEPLVQMLTTLLPATQIKVSSDKPHE